MENSQAAIAKLRSEFARAQASERIGPFQPSLEVSTSVSLLTQDLETKRQLDSLSSEEKAILAEITVLWQEIARFNDRAQAGKVIAPAEAHTYSLRDSKILPTPDPEKDKPKLEPHPITAEQAEQIILGLNKQFEEKVMSQRMLPEAGQNLQEYISRIKVEKPRLPFAGEESHIDLEKLKESV